MQEAGPRGTCQSLSVQLYKTGVSRWDLLLAAREVGKRQSGYHYMYPILLPLTDAGPTGLADVCPGAILPFYRRGSQMPTSAETRVPRGDKQGGKRRGARVTLRCQAGPSTTVCPSIRVHRPTQARGQEQRPSAGRMCWSVFLWLEPMPCRPGLDGRPVPGKLHLQRRQALTPSRAWGYGHRAYYSSPL